MAKKVIFATTVMTSLFLFSLFFLIGINFLFLNPGAYAANANLFVSAENDAFENYMSGPQVIEVVVNDPDINQINAVKGEPDVKVNGKQLRMVQVINGNWYGYFADRTQAQRADQIVLDAGAGAVGKSLDFGIFCSSSTASSILGTSFSETQGVAVPRSAGIWNFTNGEESFIACSPSPSAGVIINNVVRNPKSVNLNPLVPTGQIGIEDGAWPLIQLYDFNPTGNVIIQYNKGGGTQTVTLTFDTVEAFADHVFDKSSYTQDAQVEVIITDPWLNIDPTDKDSWTFGNKNGEVFYQVFNEKGVPNISEIDEMVDISSSLTNLMVEDNVDFKLSDSPSGPSPTVFTIQENGLQRISMLEPTVHDIVFSKQPVTFLESNVNTGVFVNFDNSNEANIKISSDADGTKDLIIDYNETPKTAVLEISPLLPDSSILDTNLSSLTNSFASSVNSELGLNFIQATEMNVIAVVEPENVSQTIDDLIQKTAFFDISGTTGVISTIDQFPGSTNIENYYKEQLTKIQKWPFAGGSSVSLVQPGDVVAEITWVQTNTGKQYQTLAILDKNGQVKFEPLMYFSVKENDIVDRQTLEVKNFFGWTVVKFVLGMKINTDDTGCKIMTREGNIAVPDVFEIGPIWEADYKLKDQKWSPGKCHKNGQPVEPEQNRDCADAEGLIAYSAFLPNWNISPTKFEISKGDLPISTGIKTLSIPQRCVLEFPITAVLTLVIAISGMILFMRTESLSNLLRR